MIICDKYKFVFIHIPKCAGTSVRQVLQKFDSTNGKFSPPGKHTLLGGRDMVHLPLFVLRQHFPQEYQKIRNYFSIAVLRDPFSRFPSSLYQRLAMYSGTNIKCMSRTDFIAALNGTVEFLSKQPRNSCLPYDYIHFQRQIDFVYDKNTCCIKSLYVPQNLKKMFNDIGNLVDEDLGSDCKPEHLNKSVVYKTDLFRMAASIIQPLYIPPVQKCLPLGAKEYFKRLFYTSSKNKFGDIFQSQTISNFISEYYAEDINLYEMVRL